MNLGSQIANKQLHMMPSSSGASWKSAGAADGAVPDQFPAGLRVLVVDDDPTCLMILEKMLRNCNYEVTKCNRAEVALSLLRENKNGFDIVISDVHMPDMDGFKLLEHIGLEMDLPVIMMSADDSKNVVMKGVTHGACDYLIKPVRIEALRNIWQHVVRKRKHEWKDFEPSASVDDGERQQKPPEDPDYSSSANEGSNWKNSKRRKDDEDEAEAEERDDSSSLKKPRVVWSVELHQQFVAAVNQLGIDKAVPKKILELMNVPGLTRENVASHLQKYRLYLRRLSGSQHPSGLNTSFMGNPDGGFGSMSPLNGLDLQALAASGQLPAQSLATLQSAALGRPNNTKSPISVPLMDQRNLFSFENPKVRYGEVQGQHMNSSGSNKQMSLLHGIPTNMEPKQLVGLHQSTQHSFGGMNNQVLIPMGSGQTQSNNNNHHGPRQPVLSSGILTRGGVVNNIRDTASLYNPVGSQPSSLVDFSMNHKTDLPGSSFPIGSGPGISTHAPVSVLQGDGNSENQNSRGGILPGYDILNDSNQNRSQDWGLPNVGLEGGLDVPPSVLLQHSYSSGQKMGGPSQSLNPGKVMFSAGEGSGAHRNGANIVQQHNAYLGDNSLRVKPEGMNDGTSHNFNEQYSQDDLLTAILKQQQQQEGVGQAENEFGFDSYALDNYLCK